MIDLSNRPVKKPVEQRRKPQPVQTEWAKGSMEWLAAQNKSS
jgi:hypothetical protein